jgi:ABC-type polysaccharide transport system permease subunit
MSPNQLVHISYSTFVLNIYVCIKSCISSNKMSFVLAQLKLMKLRVEEYVEVSISHFVSNVCRYAVMVRMSSVDKGVILLRSNYRCSCEVRLKVDLMT